MAKIRTRKRGHTWSYSFEIGKAPASGKRKMKEKGGFASQDEAYDAGVEAYADWKHGNIGITSEKVTVNDFFASWIEKVVRPNVKESTHRHYMSRYRTSISPCIGSMYLQDVKPHTIDTLIRGMAEQGKSHETISATLAVLRIMFKYAVYPAELIQTNPAAYISVPRSAPTNIIERHVISKEEFAAILASFQKRKNDIRFRIPVMLGYYLGLRIGEALGLVWEDIDFDKKTVHISRQLAGELSNLYFSTPKTKASTRTIYASDAIIGELKAWRKIQQENRLRLGSSYQMVYESSSSMIKVLPLAAGAKEKECHLVCTDIFGLPVRRERLTKRLQKLGTNFHSLRHTHATRLIEAGAKPVDVAARLGHADVSITENLYSHDTEKMARETANLVDKVM